MGIWRNGEGVNVRLKVRRIQVKRQWGKFWTRKFVLIHLYMNC